MLRRVIGDSMLPHLKPGKIVVGVRWYRSIVPGDIVIIQHDGLEKVKRICRLDAKRQLVYAMGDNAGASTDSRHFGWLPLSAVAAKLVWPSL